MQLYKYLLPYIALIVSVTNAEFGFANVEGDTGARGENLQKKNLEKLQKNSEKL